jgi:hypothetical protein
MTEELLEKSNELKQEISKFKSVIGDLSYRICCVKNKDKHPYNCSAPTDIFYRMKLRLRNKYLKDNIKQANIIIFDNDHVCGTEIDVDEEFALYVKKYFEAKLNETEKKFNELN